MAKRKTGIDKKRAPHSRKTRKRLATKRERLAALAAKRARGR